MSGHPPLVATTIEAYRKRRQKRTPVIIGVIAILLVVVGVIILVVGFSNRGGFHLFSTQTPTPTITPSPTNTPTPTETPTTTSTPTETLTPTPAAPYSYIVQEGDYLVKIIKAHSLGENDLLLILILNPYHDPYPGAALENSIDPIAQIVYVGQKITLPPPGMLVPTATSIPANAPRGYKITYFVLPGDSLGGIANKWNSTVNEIIKANKELLADGAATVIYPGWTLVVPINIVTPQPTSMTAPTATNTPTATSTP
jgi:LysM repeat protein